MLVLSQLNTTVIDLGNASISIATIAELFNSGINLNSKNIIELYVKQVNTKFNYNMVNTIMINEPQGYGQFLHAIEEQHTNELFAVYELIHIDLSCQNALSTYLKTLNSKIAGGTIEEFLLNGNVFLA
ncbi:hypothetical protein [Photobacterium leiognathi]|uniref:hypothetical protein n=1 Tax=Photobacterium leiognathi TaxID=553611 RepID=UPI00298297C2|nr:hypothetical protein [Photobacterium leiognathi]